MKRFDPFELLPVKEQNLTPGKFKQVMKADRSNIQEARFVPPRLGSEGFGHFHVTYKNPVFSKLAND